MPPDSTARSLRTLLAHSVDYAGLFPPAGLDMDQAVRNYAAYLTGRHHWMLGRFVLPASRLEELAAALGSLPNGVASAWPLSVLPGADPPADIERALEFSIASGNGTVSVGVAELKAHSPGEIEQIAAELPPGPRYFFEVPLGTDLVPFAASAALAGVGLKARTGGITADAFPPARQVAGFLRAAVECDVPFKFTAGLHHPIRGEYRLTYEQGAPCGTMFGFLNAFLAAALAVAGADEEELVPALTEAHVGALAFESDSVTWRGHTMDGGVLARTRELLAGFGSCSFTEPVDELTAAGLLQ
jgi:hypothetical protein